MDARARSWIGRLIPSVDLAEFRKGELCVVNSRDVLGRGRVLVAGMPGAFTPVCSTQHAPILTAHARQLSSFFDQIVCLVSSDPFVLSEWSPQVDPNRSLHFLSDGNLDFADALGLVSPLTSYFLGERSNRYSMTLSDGLIQTLRVESSALDFQCTRPDNALEYL